MTERLKLFSLILAAALTSAAPLFAALPAKAAQESIALAAKVSGRALNPAAREAAEAALRKAASQYGDDVAELSARGGLESLEQSARYGDDFWTLARSVPSATRSLALNADELIPLAKRVGPEVLQIEARAPGLSLKIASEFGDGALKTLSAAPAADLSRLLGYASKADNPETRQLLLKCYSSSKNPAKFLESLNWKQIMAAGLSTGAVIAAYKVSDGVEAGLETVAANHPEAFADTVTAILSPFRWGLLALLAILLYPLAVISWRLGGKLRGGRPGKN